MEESSQRQNPEYCADLTDSGIRAVFDGAADFVVRELQCGKWMLYAYAIDGLTSGSAIAESVF